ncbi:NAD(P)-dependent oxidoreductase [Mycolicibacterium sp. BiH015]|uniref:NAD-dependent epimerase/dehydratase family protein n=1 Tax=Mycolicibacterium sp. BiH015 TaxID=3018808 RepID=UPI0022E97162|nr:NAD(P)-dependent oxidoreductase [Mycolicibacterium sp. BiH015]MDA2895024.1 NAD(P)-dependent oxidoreductase [Mycolicibacterium sp. BiH015]
MTVLLTGATGLVGARLLPRLIANGRQCRALLRSGKQLPAGATAAYGDLLDADTLGAAVDGVDAIVHLAATFRTADTDLIWQSNLEGTRNLIAAAQSHAPGTRFVMASTALIYDEHAGRPGREDDRAEPKLDYPASKLAAESELRNSGLNWSIMRYGFVYGDGDGHLESLPELAAGRFHPAQRMSMIHHRDIAAATLLALDGRFDGRIVNIADEAPTTVYELVELVGGEMEPSSQPLATPWYIHMDGSLARRLGFRPSVRTVYQAVQEDLM